MKIYVDIDDTICHTPNEWGYQNALPLKENIDKINKLYKEGNTITYWTARGSESGADFTELTEKQLKEWGCLHHELVLKKPLYDLFIDDKCFRIEDI